MVVSTKKKKQEKQKHSRRVTDTQRKDKNYSRDSSDSPAVAWISLETLNLSGFAWMRSSAVRKPLNILRAQVGLMTIVEHFISYAARRVDICFGRC